MELHRICYLAALIRRIAACPLLRNLHQACAGPLLWHQYADGEVLAHGALLKLLQLCLHCRDVRWRQRERPPLLSTPQWPTRWQSSNIDWPATSKHPRSSAPLSSLSAGGLSRRSGMWHLHAFLPSPMDTCHLSRLLLLLRLVNHFLIVHAWLQADTCRQPRQYVPGTHLYPLIQHGQ